VIAGIRGNRGWLAVCLLAILCSCVNQQEEIQTYRKIVDTGATRPNGYVDGQPISLHRALELANDDNEQIALNGENYLQALYEKNRLTAAFLPTVSLQPSFEVEQRPAIGTVTPGQPTQGQIQSAAKGGGWISSGDTWYQTNVPVVGAMNLNPVGSAASVESQDETIIQQKQLLLDAQATVLLNVAETYYQVLRSEQQVRVLTESLQVDQARLRDVNGRFANHLALALEVSQTRAQAASTSADLTQAETDVRNGRRTLAFLIGEPAVSGPLSDDLWVPQGLPDVDDFRKMAGENRQDLLAAESAIRAAKYSVDAAVAEYYPSVSLNVAGFLYRQYFSDASKWDALLSANLPIFSAGIIEADVRTAWSKLRQAALFQAMLRRQIDQDVQTAYDNLTSTDRRLADLRVEVEAASDARQQSEQLLNNGLAIPLDVLTAQETLLDAQLLYTSASFDRSVFYLDLLRTTGELNTAPPIVSNPATQPSATQP
jgi:outer membrane protein TolC